jgi:hypothetical protein
VDFLTINGVVYWVRAPGAREREPFRVGAVRRAASGLARSSVRAEKRVLEYLLLHMTRADFDALRATIANGAVVTVGGASIGPSTIQAIVLMKDAEFVPEGTDFTMTPQIEVWQV